MVDRLGFRPGSHSCTRVALLSLGLALTAASGTTNAETLAAALARAYTINPDLLAGRAALRGIDEEVAIARGGYRPTISADGSGSWTDLGGDEVARGTVGLQLDQPLFDGFRTRNALGSARARVESGRGSLADIEQTVLLAATTAYADVGRDRAIVAVRLENLEFLQQQVSTADTRFRIGDGTRTAVSQAEARRAQAEAHIAAARAELEASVARYRQITGADLGEFTAPEVPEALLPVSLTSARGIALEVHPDVVAAREAARAAGFDVDIARGALLPTLGVRGRLERLDDDFTDGDPRRQDGTTVSVSLQLRVPLYEAGVNAARTRQRRERQVQSARELDSARNGVTASLESAWSRLAAVRAATAATTLQVAAAELARDGVVNERDAGLSTQLDVLIAQQDVLDARVASVSAERDALVAGYAVLEAIGSLRASTLKLAVEAYDFADHFEAVEGQLGTRPRGVR